RRPERSGLNALTASRARRRSVPVVLPADRDNFRTTVHAMKDGSFDLLGQLAGNQELKGALRRILEQGPDPAATPPPDVRPAQSAEVLGRLIDSVVHDFDRILTAVLVSGDRLRSAFPPAHPLRGHVEEILKAGTRAMALTRQLLNFSRKQVQG